ncbi:uncharacterized protein K460DRAFT_281662 [Cucurbitaria berberidis CBS 394.84]|uniref:Uncharacterized protein n=1 Tax=Cucurbitaria berberidis CBS 394.84 TaxID=1168544 RepID=A0A9P4L8U2_9PLEO|nr:uncharacterized protein K460DRAFT_281662 [Cucurbitaria berberidis CBS 394.84]KAF1846410.1 hypothetical protein K460DRAFT_281662 [Cucurbitaria berberidis CBS 394.84]
MNNNEAAETESGPSDYHRNEGQSQPPASARNQQHPAVSTNRGTHNDFDYLNIPTPAPVEVSLPKPRTFNFPNAQTEAKYIACMRGKLLEAKNYILKEQELGLDPDRPGMHKELTAILLAQPPIKIDMNAQQLVRLLLLGAVQLKELARERTAEDPQVLEAMADYWLFWTQLRAILVWQMPGRDEGQRVERADAMMSEVLEKIVEP